MILKSKCPFFSTKFIGLPISFINKLPLICAYHSLRSNGVNLGNQMNSLNNKKAGEMLTNLANNSKLGTVLLSQPLFNHTNKMVKINLFYYLLPLNQVEKDASK